jgi:hypothetical protein
VPLQHPQWLLITLRSLNGFGRATERRLHPRDLGRWWAQSSMAPAASSLGELRRVSSTLALILYGKAPDRQEALWPRSQLFPVN